MTIPAAVLAAVLFAGMAAFQASLALGSPLGGHVLGGRYPGALRSASEVGALFGSGRGQAWPGRRRWGLTAQSDAPQELGVGGDEVVASRPDQVLACLSCRAAA
jgi:hypothetical protein